MMRRAIDGNLQAAAVMVWPVLPFLLFFFFFWAELLLVLLLCKTESLREQRSAAARLEITAELGFWAEEITMVDGLGILKPW
jgi:hypothetical protein